MENFTVTHIDSFEPVVKIAHEVTINWGNNSRTLRIIETNFDLLNSDFQFEDVIEGEGVALDLGISIDDLMDECLEVIQKVS